MSCACDNRKRQEDKERMRMLARKVAKMEGRIYILYERKGVFDFIPDGEDYEGEFVEYVWY